VTRREADIFACLVDTVVAPAPPLPPVSGTDAVAFFDTWLAAAPRLNRAGLRALLLALEVAPRLTGAGARLRRLDADARLAFLRRAPRGLVEPLRAAAAMSYYGDPGVAAYLGFDR
jgi:hypothetical protein